MCRKGRKPKHHVTDSGEVIVGLRRDKKSRRFYPVGKGSPSFGSDELKAVHRFRVWQAQQGEQPKPSVPITLPATVEAFDSAFSQPTILLSPPSEPGTFVTDLETVKRQERIRLRKLIYTDPKQAALELDCEPVALLANVKNLAPISGLSLREVGEITYGERDGEGSRLAGDDTNELQKMWRYWQEFCQAVKVTNVDEVTTDHLDAYRKHVAKVPGKKPDTCISSRTIKNRYDRIGEILNYAYDRRESHQTVIDTLRKRFRVIVRKSSPKVAKPIPTPIDPEDFAACLGVADVKWKAVLLLMLNCGLHPGECTGLYLDDIDFRKGWLWDKRNKNQEQRCSPLWKETLDALKAYLKEYKPDGSYIFVNKAKKRQPTGEFGKEFYAKVRDPAGVKRVTLEWFRDGGTDAASKRHVDTGKVQMWLGQDRGGQIDKYDPRHPTKTQPVVDAIYAEYFGGK